MKPVKIEIQNLKTEHYSRHQLKNTVIKHNRFNKLLVSLCKLRIQF